ncbi:MAG: hypothetical protein ACXWMX_05835, partial [Candidatus Limnocylindrales bacterium]
MLWISRRHRMRSLAVAALLLLAACASPQVTSNPISSTSPVAPPASPATASSSSSSPNGSPTPAATTGFAFTADDVVAYYKSQGYRCG